MDANAVLSHLSDYRAEACSVQASNSAMEAKVKQLETEVRALFSVRILHCYLRVI